jgi:hypothetical protein
MHHRASGFNPRPIVTGNFWPLRGMGEAGGAVAGCLAFRSIVVEGHDLLSLDEAVA